MLPEDWKQQLDGYDAIYFGAVGTFKLQMTLFPANAHR